MATAKQIAANRANAKKSTGPRTAAGCAKSSRNAYRHGLSVPVQPDPQAVDALAKAIAGETAGEVELRAARALAEAQLELKQNPRNAGCRHSGRAGSDAQSPGAGPPVRVRPLRAAGRDPAQGRQTVAGRDRQPPSVTPQPAKRPPRNRSRC